MEAANAAQARDMHEECSRLQRANLDMIRDKEAIEQRLQILELAHSGDAQSGCAHQLQVAREPDELSSR